MLKPTSYRLATQLTVLDALGQATISELLPANAGTATRNPDPQRGGGHRRVPVAPARPAGAAAPPGCAE